MRILIVGLLVFVLWSLFSVWLYVEKIRPGMTGPEAEQTIPENQGILTDSTLVLEKVAPADFTVFFDFDYFKFVPDAMTEGEILEFITWLNENPLSKLSVTGFTDIIGTSEYNRALGMLRATAVGDYLEGKGIATDKIYIRSEGKDKPVGSQATEAGRAKNRRAIITINK